MTELEVDGNLFKFDDGCDVLQYDEWSFFNNRIKSSVSRFGPMACDFVVVDGETLYLIEAKDYSYPPGTTMPKIDDLAETVSAKGFQTLAGLFAGARYVSTGGHDFCVTALKCTRVVICLSIEPPRRLQGRLWRDQPMKLLREAVKRRVKYLETRPQVISNKTPNPALPWTSRRIPRD